MDVTDQSAGHPTDYQRMLRAIGAHLDQEGRGRFRLIEVPDGFTLFVEETSSRPTGREVRLSIDDLAGRAESLEKGRKFLGTAQPNSWELVSTTHQDFLRALGWELTETSAHALLIDELEDGLLVTYSYLDPARGFQWRKRMLHLHSGDMEGIIEAGRRRRVKRGRFR
jgi:hypothetical protein